MRYKSSRKNTYRGKRIKKNTQKRKKGKTGGNKIRNPDKWMEQLAVKQLLDDNLTNNTSGMEKYLTKVCPDSNNCLAFGPDAAVVKEYFENFDSFKYVVQTKNLATGASGVVTKLVFKRGKYTTTALLKTSTSRESDNLLFEAYIGYNYINVQSMYFPCFINTYGASKGDDQIQIPFPATKEYVNLSCSEQTTNGILIQNINNAETLHNYLKTNTVSDITLTQILYQVYSALSVLKNEFTHYDLHANNVVLYKVPNNKVIEMKYYGADGTVKAQFHTMYIAKIIDYGRCYTSLNTQYYDMICNAEACGPSATRFPCGYKDGYSFFDNRQNQYNFYISMLHPNISHDLRLAYSIGIPITIYSKLGANQYGVPSTPTSAPANNISVYNVDDMAEALRLELIRAENLHAHSNIEKMATLSIYLDRSKPMKYEPAN